MPRDRQYWISLWTQKRSQPECPFCREDRWIGWDDVVRLEQVGTGVVVWPQGVEVVPLTCAGCGFVRFQNPAFRDVEAV